MANCKCKKPKRYTSLDRGDKITVRCKICGKLI